MTRTGWKPQSTTRFDDSARRVFRGLRFARNLGANAITTRHDANAPPSIRPLLGNANSAHPQLRCDSSELVRERLSGFWPAFHPLVSLLCVSGQHFEQFGLIVPYELASQSASAESKSRLDSGRLIRARQPAGIASRRIAKFSSAQVQGGGGRIKQLCRHRIAQAKPAHFPPLAKGGPGGVGPDQAALSPPHASETRDSPLAKGGQGGGPIHQLRRHRNAQVKSTHFPPLAKGGPGGVGAGSTSSVATATHK